MVVCYYDHVIQINMCIPVTVNVWTICYIILGCFVVIEIGFEIVGCRPIAFGRERLGIGNRIMVLIS